MAKTIYDDKTKGDMTKRSKRSRVTNTDLLQDDLSFLAKKKEEITKGKTKTEVSKEDDKAASFLKKKKKEMKECDYRKKFDVLYQEIRDEMLDTSEKNPSAYSVGGSKQWTKMFAYVNGGANYRPVYRLEDTSTSVSSLPRSSEPYIFSKVLVAAALFGARIPDGTFKAQDVVWASTMYKLWADSWKNPQANGENSLETFVQNIFTYGWGVKRIYPKRIQQMSNGVPRILFDDLYRQTLRPNKTWLGVGYRNSDYWSQGETLYEEELGYDDFEVLFPDACTPENVKKLEFVRNGSTEDGELPNVTGGTYKEVVISHYENVLKNRHIKACGDYIIYDGELVNDDGYSTIQVANCYVRNNDDPYGVGLWELGRSNGRVADHLRLLNLEQVEAEVAPILFGAVQGPGNNTYQRGSGIINPKIQGTSVDVVRTTGNVAQGMGVVKSERNSLDAITGINDVVAGLGSETTLGATVLAKEAAQQRLVLPRNSIIRALQKDAYVCVSFQKQLYPVPYIYAYESEEDKERFVMMNDSYFTTEAKLRGKPVVLASKKLSINFDFNLEELDVDEVDESGIPMEEKKTEIVVSRTALFDALDQVKEKTNLSRVLEITIDPNSMLQPSTEITKQNIAGLYPIITEQVQAIYAAAQSEPELAVTMMKQLERLLTVNREDLYDWLPRSFVDKIIAGEMMNNEMVELVKMNRMSAMQEQMAAMGMPPEQGQQGQQVTEESIAQNPMQAAMNASTGRASQVDEGQAV